MTKKEIFSTKVLDIAAANLNGFTVDATTLQPTSGGFAVAIAATQFAFGLDGIDRVFDAIQAGKATAVGGWYNENDGQYYFDAVIIYSDKDLAIQAGKENEQIAIFDLNNLEEIRL